MLLHWPSLHAGLKVVAAGIPPTSLDLEAPSPALQSDSPGSAAAATAGSSSRGGLSGSSAAASSSQHRSSSDGVALASGAPGSGGLRQLRDLELDVGRAMSPAVSSAAADSPVMQIFLLSSGN